jgi:homocysteine-responsive ER-resident protein 1 with ubiquitin-like domain
MQHMYAQYMTQYMQYMQAAASASYPQAAAATAATFIPPPPAPPAANLEAPQAQNNDNGAAAAAVVPPQPQVMNAGAGGAMGAALEDEDNQQRDALDWLYIASRVLVLLSIVYFYSSLTRFLVVTVCGFFAYLWNIGAFRRDAAPPIINNNNDLGRDSPIFLQFFYLFSIFFLNRF